MVFFTIISSSTTVKLQLYALNLKTAGKTNLIRCITSGAHQNGSCFLNYDIDFSFCARIWLPLMIKVFGQVNSYTNINIHQVSPNDVYVWKNIFIYIDFI